MILTTQEHIRSNFVTVAIQCLEITETATTQNWLGLLPEPDNLNNQ